jgi:thioredoxin-related protein
MGIPPQLGPGGKGFGGTPLKPGGNTIADAEAAAKALGQNEADLAWTDPDNPDAELPELQELMAAGPTKGAWMKSETEALRESRKTGKPLLIWFTDSARSSTCKTLSQQLLTTQDFQNWADENTVRLVVDQTGDGDIDMATRKKVYARNLKKKYAARGYPTLMVVSPSSEVIGRYTGYRRGKEDFIFGQVKQGVEVANENRRVWHSSLEKKGYRMWSDGKGHDIFAKLGYYKDGNLILVEPEGGKVRVSESRLSAGDRVWIQKQKEIRGIQ